MMSKYKSEEMPQEVKDMYDSIHASMIIIRMAYDSALEEGFTPNQALTIANDYMKHQMSLSMMFGGMRR